MAVPDYQSIMLPLLRWLADGQEKRLPDAVNAMAVEFGLTEADREQLMGSGQTAIYNRVAWACTYLSVGAAAIPRESDGVSAVLDLVPCEPREGDLVLSVPRRGTRRA